MLSKAPSAPPSPLTLWKAVLISSPSWLQIRSWRALRCVKAAAGSSTTGSWCGLEIHLGMRIAYFAMSARLLWPILATIKKGGYCAVVTMKEGLGSNAAGVGSVWCLMTWWWGRDFPSTIWLVLCARFVEERSIGVTNTSSELDRFVFLILMSLNIHL